VFDRDLSILVDKIVDADFDVQFSRTANDVLTGGFVIDTKNQWVGLGKSLHTLDKLWKIGGVLGLDSDSDDRRHGVFHVSDIVGFILCGNGTGFGDVLIDTNKGSQVTAWDFGNELSLSSHHKHSSLNITIENISFASWFEVGTQHSDLKTSGDLSGESSSVGVESTLIGGWYLLGNVHHQWTFLVAVSNSLGGFIINWTFVKVAVSVPLGDLGGWQMEHHHFQDGIGGVNPLLHNSLQQVF
jgi:hypothetical protein